jgi:sugar/nucleoside kinase (ribokinase family)
VTDDPSGRPSLVIVGAASRDLDERDPRGWRLGGSVTYGALLAARLGARVGALIGVDSAAATEGHELDLLRRAGADVRLVPLARGPVFDNVQTPRGREQIGHEGSDPIPPSALPEAWRDCDAFLLGPVANEIPDAWAASPRADALVALAWQGLLRRIEPGKRVVEVPARPGPLFARSDLGSVSVEDLRAGGDRLDRLLPRVGQRLAITADEHGALFLLRGETGLHIRKLPSIPVRRTVDTTGAGDAFHTTWFLGSLADGPFGPVPLPEGRALYVAAIVGSLAVETYGLAGVPDRTMTAQRIAELTRPAAATPPLR